MSTDSYIVKEERAERVEMLTVLRNQIRNCLDQYVENLDFGMPTFYYKGQCICAIASQKGYMTFYVMPYDLLDKFEQRLNKFNRGKSCIRFKKMEEEDLELFMEILEHCKLNYPKSRFYGKMNPRKK